MKVIASGITRSMSLVLALVVGIAVTAPASEQMPVDGVLGIVSENGTGWFAVKVEINSGDALGGVVWYNNDRNVVMPHVFAGTGYETGPGVVSAMFSVAEQVSGNSSDWSEVLFNEPIVPSLGSLYVVFELPEGVVYSGAGTGGGAAFGYCESGPGLPGWLSDDGEDWAAVHRDFSLAFQPIVVPVEDGMMVKRLDDAHEETELAAVQRYLTAGPNPFNPTTTIRFGLLHSGEVKLNIYDLRGRRVRDLVHGVWAAGHHAVQWDGRDGRGKMMASGVYVARLKTAAEVMQHRMLLLK